MAQLLRKPPGFCRPVGHRSHPRRTSTVSGRRGPPPHGRRGPWSARIGLHTSYPHTGPLAFGYLPSSGDLHAAP